MAETSIRDDIVAAMAATPAESVQPGPELGSSPPESLSSPAADAPSAEPPIPETRGESDGKTRGPDGKFIKAEAAPDKAAPAATESPVDQPGLTPEAPAPKFPRWTAEMKVEFAKLPENVQKYILDRERDTDRTVGTKGAESEKLSRQAAEFEQVVSPYKDRIALNGSTPMQTVRTLLAAEDALQRDPYGSIQHLARVYGVDLNRFAQAPQNQQPQLPPELQPLYQEVNTLKQYLLGQQQQGQQQQMSGIQADLQQFSQTAEHLTDVESDMVPFVASIRQQNPQMSNQDVLKAAYDRACWANPHIRTLMQQQATASAETKRRSDAAAAAKEAQRKGVSLSGAPGGMPIAEGEDSIRGDIQRAMKAHRA